MEVQKYGERIPNTKSVKIHQWQTGEVFLYSRVQLNKLEKNFIIRQILKPKKTEECSFHAESQEMMCKEFSFESFGTVNPMEAEIDKDDQM